MTAISTLKPEDKRPAAWTNAVFGRSSMGVKAGDASIASGGGGGSSSGKSSCLPTPPDQDAGDAEWLDSVGWLFSDVCASTTSEWEKGRKGSVTGPFSEFVEDAKSWGESSYYSGERSELSMVEGGRGK